jgi:hypothetical protein
VVRVEVFQYVEFRCEVKREEFDPDVPLELRGQMLASA